MIELTQAETAINASIDTIFDYVTNMENYKHWFPGVVSIGSMNDLNHGALGKTYVETLSLPEGHAELIIEVDQSEKNQRFVTKGNLAGVLPQMTVLFSSNETGGSVINLQYCARDPQLTESDGVVLMLREDLKTRTVLGLKTLKSIMEG